jgi:hypothetical protein
MTEGDNEDTSPRDDRPDAQRKMSSEERQKLRGEQGTSSGNPHDDTDTDSGA